MFDESPPPLPPLPPLPNPIPLIPYFILPHHHTQFFPLFFLPFPFLPNLFPPRFAVAESAGRVLLTGSTSRYSSSLGGASHKRASSPSGEGALCAALCGRPRNLYFPRRRATAERGKSVRVARHSWRALGAQGIRQPRRASLSQHSYAIRLPFLFQCSSLSLSVVTVIGGCSTVALGLFSA